MPKEYYPYVFLIENESVDSPHPETFRVLWETGISAVILPEFDACMEEQRTRARAATAAAGDFAWAGSGLGAVEAPTKFVGYDQNAVDTTITQLFVDGEARGTVLAGTECMMLLSESPFYAESGGQVGDTGVIRSANGAEFHVTDVKKTPDGKWLHSGTVVSGEFSVSDAVTAQIDLDRRSALRRAHSSTHLLQAALRERLGTHVAQAGSLVEPDMLRFDFTHFSAMTPEDIAAVEKRVNEWILAGLPISTTEMKIDDAKAAGATALFGEKYGDVVRVVNMGGWSVELCGGTHVAALGEIGFIKILGEGAISAGTRRIEAVAGVAALNRVDKMQSTLGEVSRALSCKPEEASARLKKLVEAKNELERELKNFRKESAGKLAKSLANDAILKDGKTPFMVRIVEAENPAEMRQLAVDAIRERPDGVAVLGAAFGEKATVLALCSPDAVAAGIKAGDIVRELAGKLGGKGGGKPDFAQGGGSAKDIAKIFDEYKAEIK